ncbi:MAG: diaminopimelate epimerase [Cellulomonas sp. 73-145]|uniref:diaminopimelate epimerase n=1 Tax=Cellulomonas sp. 73-145 TaxID=1895739 RepID=UPI00092C5F30|nr:diaminopimelate epimerase [Cellulomonas sp. 73-145]MBN9328623.1 diaminopimelate epimerase [Cellulomonas sp.]OJV59518.1 MAG: diaminopimelate epimerase [Cellulomonas sp. 73-145]
MTSVPAAQRLHVAKGHGTRNDFVLIDDRDGSLDLTPALVQALCERRAGIGGDGVIRLVASRRLVEDAATLAADAGAEWFMDYRNADGSVAQMCGNGVRVLAALVRSLGLWDPRDGELVLGTRAGVRRVREVPVPAGVADERWYAVDMGVWSLPGGAAAVQAGGDATVDVPGLRVARPALSVDMGNPHTVVVVADADELERADLTREPTVRPLPPEGTNTELVLPLGERATEDGGTVGVVRMRVYERGVGETASCGTGACAAALAVRTWAGDRAPDEWLVHVPGGTLRVTARADGHVELAGPAVLVAEATVDLATLTLS